MNVEISLMTKQWLLTKYIMSLKSFHRTRSFSKFSYCAQKDLSKHNAYTNISYFFVLIYPTPCSQLSQTINLLIFFSLSVSTELTSVIPELQRRQERGRWKEQVLDIPNKKIISILCLLPSPISDISIMCILFSLFLREIVIFNLKKQLIFALLCKRGFV